METRDMRSDDEDDEEEYDEEVDEEDDEMRPSPTGGDGAEDDEDAEGTAEDGSDEVEGSEDEDGEGDEDEDEDDDEEVDDDDEDDDEEDEEEHSDEEDNEDVDVEMDANDEDEAGSSRPSQRSRPSTTHSKARSPIDLPPPPHLIRRSLFAPNYPTSSRSLSIEAVVAIPLPSPVHSLASTACLSYLLTGSQEGHIRCYDFWASVNGGQPMTAQQRGAVGLGEGVGKAGVARGWWTNEVEGSEGRRSEPVYSMACEGDGLWALTGTKTGSINLYTLRHSPGHFVHSLRGHDSVVSCMALLPGEKSFMSGSWDGTIRDWDLNTGQTVRQYPPHGAQISSISLRPFHPSSPSPSPAADVEDESNEKDRVSVRMSPGFFDKPAESAEEVDEAEKDTEEREELAEVANGDVETPVEHEEDAVAGVGAPALLNGPELLNGDAEVVDAPSPYDSLFDDDGKGEPKAPLGDITLDTTPLITSLPPSSPQSRPFGLALPSQAKHTPSAPLADPASLSVHTPLFSVPAPASSSRQGLASSIPLLTPQSWQSYSSDILLTSSMDGQVTLIDRRVPESPGNQRGVGRLLASEKAPPWCMSAAWAGGGNQVLAGRRNGTIDIWDVRKSSSSTRPHLLRTLRTSAESGPVSCVSGLWDGRHILTASQDNVRLWDTEEVLGSAEEGGGMGPGRRKGSKPPFKIIAGHHGGTISSMLVDATGRFLITASGDRGWQGESTKVVLIHEIKW